MHNDDDCPNVESVKKLKAELKRLRIELLNSGKSKKNLNAIEESDE